MQIHIIRHCLHVYFFRDFSPALQGEAERVKIFWEAVGRLALCWPRVTGGCPA
jgi:hypothetical protein